MAWKSPYLGHHMTYVRHGGTSGEPMGTKNESSNLEVSHRRKGSPWGVLSVLCSRVGKSINDYSQGVEVTEMELLNTDACTLGIDIAKTGNIADSRPYTIPEYAACNLLPCQSLLCL